MDESFDVIASEFVTRAMLTNKTFLRGSRISWQSGAELREKAVQRGTRSGATRDKTRRTSGAVLKKLLASRHVDNLAFLQAKPWPSPCIRQESPQVSILFWW